LRASIPELVVHHGHFLTHEVSAPLAQPVPGQPPTVRVLKTEEKGSDVNLAVHLLNDAWLEVGAPSCHIRHTNRLKIGPACGSPRG